MKRLAVVALLTLVLALALGSMASAQPAPEFRLGFKALADQAPQVVGQPLENEHWGDNGDSLQQTSTGLMAWRKADNWTAFTNGAITWINGPAGVQSRPNADRFDWEALPTIELKGKGQSVTQKFDLQEGVKIIRATHKGQRNFIVQLMDESGKPVDYLANEIGAYDGTQAAGIRKTGQYLLDVNADGDWAITIEQPRPTSGVDLPQTFSGKGQSVTPFINLNSGLVVATVQHSGKRNFIVELLDRTGQSADLVANQIGNFSGEKAIGVGSIIGPKPGLHILDVRGDGEWTVTLQYK